MIRKTVGTADVVVCRVKSAKKACVSSIVLMERLLDAVVPVSISKQTTITVVLVEMLALKGIVAKMDSVKWVVLPIRPLFAVKDAMT